MTREEKSELRDWVATRRTAHHRALETLRAPGCETSGLDLWRKLVSLERLAHAGAEAFCNGERVIIAWPLFGVREYNFGRDGSEAWDQMVKVGRDCIRNIFGHVPAGLFFNGDARGSAIKLDAEKVAIPEGMQTDWGRDGILAAEITDGNA